MRDDYWTRAREARRRYPAMCLAYEYGDTAPPEWCYRLAVAPSEYCWQHSGKKDRDEIRASRVASERSGENE
jgi:hypothetical protein